MKIKEYLNSLVNRRKSSSTSKPKSHHSTSDGQYEICGYEDPNRYLLPDQPSRTAVLLNRHAQLVNTIVEIRSQQDCREPLPSGQEKVSPKRNYSSTLATSNPRRERQHQTINEHSLSTKIRQRSKIRTNPWIATPPVSKIEHHSASSTGLIHSESFPQTVSNIVLHQSDSGQGFSLSSSRVIDSSSPDNTSSDGPIFDKKRRYSSREKKSSIQTGYQRPSNIRVMSSPRKQHSHLRDDHFSAQFEDLVENERLRKQRSPSRKSPFILPLEETMVPSTTLKKTNSHTILKHLEEIENEIRLIKNLNLDPDEQIFSANNDERQSIHEQVDQWIEQCLTTPEHPHPPAKPIPDYVVRVCSDRNHQTSSLPKPPKKGELMTAFYVSSIPTTPTTHFQPIVTDLKSNHECPF